MIEVVLNVLGDDGLRRVRVISDDEIQHPVRYFAPLPVEGRKLLQVVESVDAALGIHSLEVAYPVYGPFDVAILSPKKFRMFVNFVYGSRVSECIELGRVEFFCRTRFAPAYAFIRNLPAGAVDGMDVHGLVLIEAEWMPLNCVAVGGR
jgi:hypothetical protein